MPHTPAAPFCAEVRDRALCEVLNEELVCALGCTEPISVAYAAALARETLGAEPEHLEVGCSGNIVKNVKSVSVPNSDGMHGIEAAATLGAVGGDAGEPQALPHAERVGLHAAVVARVEADEREQVVRNGAGVREAEGEGLGNEVVSGGEAGQDAGALDEGTDAREALRGGAAAHGVAEEDDLAGRGARQAADHLHRGGLARAVPAHEAVDVARGDGHVEAVDGKLAPVALGEAVRLYDVHARSFLEAASQSGGQSFRNREPNLKKS